MADQVCTTAQVKARLDISDATYDTLISEIIDQVTDELEQFTGRKLVPETGATYIADTRLGHTIAVPRGIRAVSALSLATTDQPDDGTGTYVAQTLANVALRPLPIDRKPGWPATSIVLLQSTIDIRIPLRTVAAGAKIVGDWGFSPILPGVARIGITATIAEFLDRRQSGKAGAEGISLPDLLEAGDLAYLARLRPGYGIGIG